MHRLCSQVQPQDWVSVYTARSSRCIAIGPSGNKHTKQSGWEHESTCLPRDCSKTKTHRELQANARCGVIVLLHPINHCLRLRQHTDPRQGILFACCCECGTVNASSVGTSHCPVYGCCALLKGRFFRLICIVHCSFWRSLSPIWESLLYSGHNVRGFLTFVGRKMMH